MTTSTSQKWMVLTMAIFFVTISFVSGVVPNKERLGRANLSSPRNREITPSVLEIAQNVFIGENFSIRSIKCEKTFPAFSVEFTAGNSPAEAIYNIVGLSPTQSTPYRLPIREDVEDVDPIEEALRTAKEDKISFAFDFQYFKYFVVRWEVDRSIEILTIQSDSTTSTYLGGLEHCKNLRHLTMSLMLQELPISIRGCTTLTHLILANNCLVVLPDWIGELSELEEVDLSGNDLLDLPISVGSLQKLKTLRLNKTGLQVLPKGIKILSGLEVLDLSETSLRKLPEWICHLTRLKQLIVTGIVSGIKVPDCIRRLNIEFVE